MPWTGRALSSPIAGVHAGRHALSLHTPVCETCGAWFPDADAPPVACPICEDDRQWVPADGQRWTTPAGVVEGRSADVREHEPGLTGIGLVPSFAIGQRMLLVSTGEGNVLWDMIPAVIDEALEAVRARGGATAIAISHPHYYGAASAWSRELGDVPVLLHAADAEWITRPFAAVEPWEGDTRPLAGGLTLLRLGGHFPGATVLHWPAGADGRGALLSGDVVMPVPDRNVSFMWSYPNLVPLPASEVERLGRALEPWPFERIYGAWWDRVVPAGAKDAVRRSVERYVRALRGELPL
jgi:glyoxylase-like metal-dependent hydrolase (beta-lactamase superfamily II)